MSILKWYAVGMVLLLGLGYWFFNLMTYHFWLGGQDIENKSMHVTYFWVFLALLVATVVSELVLIVLSIRTLMK
jgi:hypothetical protein